MSVVFVSMPAAQGLDKGHQDQSDAHVLRQQEPEKKLLNCACLQGALPKSFQMQQHAQSPGIMGLSRALWHIVQLIALE